MGRLRRGREPWPTPEVTARREARRQRWGVRCATGAPLTPGEDVDMRLDWSADPPPPGHRWPPGWWGLYYRLRLSTRQRAGQRDG